MEGRMAAVLLVCLVIAGLPASESAYDPTKCPEIKSGIMNKLFPSIPNTFQAKIEWIIRENSRTLYMEEYFSDPNDLGAFFVTGMSGPGVTTQIITDGRTRELFTILDWSDGYGGECMVDLLTGQNRFAYPFSNVKDAKTGVVFDQLQPARNVIMMGATKGDLNYQGEAVVNGIDVEQWKGCLYMGDSDVTVAATYSFTRNDTSGRWNTASQFAPAPVRIDMQGGNPDNSTEIDQTMNYLYFDNQLPLDRLEQIFETPLGAYCVGRKNIANTPTPPDHFALRFEVIMPNKTITYSDEWYDMKSKYTRMDYNLDRGHDGISTPISQVNDFNTGIGYTINRKTGECITVPIMHDRFDDMSNGKYVQMKTADQFFNFYNDSYKWIYEGMHKTRGIDTNVWISKRPYPLETSPDMAYYEWYFAQGDWTESLGSVIIPHEPLMLKITVPALGSSVTYHVYKFNSGQPDFTIWDIEDCYDDITLERSFEIEMQAYPERMGLLTRYKLLKYWIYLSLEAFLGIRPARIVDLEMEFSYSSFLIRFTILGAPPITGDVKHPDPELSLNTAIRLLKESLAKHQFTVEYMDENATITMFAPVAGSLRHITRYNTTTGAEVDYFDLDSVPLPTTVPGTHLSSGAAFGVALICIIIGTAIILVPFLVYIRKENAIMQKYTGSQFTAE